MLAACVVTAMTSGRIVFGKLDTEKCLNNGEIKCPEFVNTLTTEIPPFYPFGREFDEGEGSKCESGDGLERDH